MRFPLRVAFSFAFAFAFALPCTPARAQTQIKGRAMVMVDSSGSMVWHFGDCNTTNGDSGNAAVFCDNNIGTGFACNQNVQCTIANGGVNLFPTTIANPSRLYAAKAALNDVLNASSGSIDYGLMRYTLGAASDYGVNVCPNANSCCQTQINATTRGRCIPQVINNYPNVPGSVACLGGANGNCNLTYASGCGTSNGCTACAGTQGGQVLIQPAANSSSSVYPWIDFVEDFCSSNGVVGGPPRNPELRAAGGTPLAGVVRTARAQWYQPIYNVSKAGQPGYNPASPLFDSKLDCRSYVNVVMTDGGEDCEAASQWFSDPQTAVQELYNVNNPTNPVKTYVIAMSFTQNELCNPSAADAVACPQTGPGGGCKVVGGQNVCACLTNADCGQTCDGFGYTCGADQVCHHPALGSLNAMAANGGSTQAHFAQNQIDIEAAFADIVVSTVKVEKCDGIDNDCDGACDEPFPDVAIGGPPGCSNGPRAAKTCNNGALAGTHCYATGTFVCSVDQLSEVCSAPTCATMASLCPTAEVCNGIDDDCNGVIDDCTPFVPNSCCTNKCPACNPTGVPQPEVCNGCDDDCDGIADNHLTDTGIACGLNVGDCVPGTTYCCQQMSPTTGTCTTDPVTQSPTHNNPDKLFCLGGKGPSAEMCDGTDHDCDGTADDLSRACYPFATGTPGVGPCRNGVQQCNAVPCGTAPNGCCPAGWPAGRPCPGAASYGACSGAVGPSPEVCNGIDDNCDGIIDDNVTDPWVGMPCCPTGNNADCMNTGTGTRCMMGAFQCVAGAKACVGGIAKSPEICNGIDDDCNGLTDDNIGGNGSPCSGPGIFNQGPCKAQYQCKAPKPGPGPNGLTCVQLVGPKPEICNGQDDDCDGVIDDPVDVAANDPRVGVVGGSPCTPLTPLPGTMFPVTGPAPPCNPGKTACVNSMVVCQGEVTPMANQCNGISTDCTGMTNSNGNCPSGFMCYQGNCYTPCSGGEFPCPGGFVCLPSKNLCIPDACVQKNCPPGQLCNIDNMGNAVCTDPCAMVTCPSGFICKLGACVDNSCKTMGCPTGQICTGTPPMCTPDPCFNVMCAPGTFCQNGMCTMTCSMCPAGEVCINGQCAMDPCKGLHCPSGQICAVVQGVGMCVDNMCVNGCGPGLACCGGSCIADACATTQCPSGSTCQLDVACAANCVQMPAGSKDEIVGAGGGGFSCAMGGSEAPSSAALFAMIFAVLIAVRRRRSPTGGAR